MPRVRRGPKGPKGKRSGQPTPKPPTGSSTSGKHKSNMTPPPGGKYMGGGY